jgi:Coenzyme PQQ synthesis protein D (PqqD)
MVQEVEGESVLLDLDGGQYFALNEVGGQIWELCDGSRSEGAIVTEVCATYDIDEATAAEDVGDLLNGLAEAGLVIER